jgi:tellurite resistance protein
MTAAASGFCGEAVAEREARLSVLGVFSVRGDRGTTEWLSIDVEVDTPTLGAEEMEVEGRLWSPLYKSWIRTWDIRHAAKEGTAVRRMGVGPTGGESTVRVELAFPTWALVSPAPSNLIELIWDVRLLDRRGRCLSNTRSERFVAQLAVDSRWMAALAQGQLAAAIGVTTASADGEISDSERTVIRVACTEAGGTVREARSTLLDMVDCLIDEPLAAWEYLESFLQTLQPDLQRAEELVELALRVASSDGPLSVEETLLIGELKRRLGDQKCEQSWSGYCVDLDEMTLVAEGQGSATDPVGWGRAALSDPGTQPLDAEALDGDSTPGTMKMADSSVWDDELQRLYSGLSDELGRLAGFARGEHRPRAETLVALLEETGVLARDLALEVRYVASICSRIACGEGVGADKKLAVVQIGREALSTLSNARG